MLGFLLQKALRNEQGEIDVLVIGLLEAVVQLALCEFPNRVAVGLDDHAAFDDLGGFRHIALQNHVLIPGGKVLASCRNRRFSHKWKGELLEYDIGVTGSTSAN